MAKTATQPQTDKPANPPATQLDKATASPLIVFRDLVHRMASAELTKLFGSEQGQVAARRVALAFRAAIASAKDPGDFLDCTPESVGTCMATSAFAQIMPGGPFPGCYLVPKRPRQGAKPALQWWINHRGIKTLARRAGQAVESVPLFIGDTFEVERGYPYRISLKQGKADRDDYSQLTAIAVIVRDVASGQILACREVTRDQIERRRRMSFMPDSGPWKEWPLEMAEKTAIKFAAGRGDVFFDEIGTLAMSYDQSESGDSLGQSAVDEMKTKLTAIPANGQSAADTLRKQYAEPTAPAEESDDAGPIPPASGSGVLPGLEATGAAEGR